LTIAAQGSGPGTPKNGTTRELPKKGADNSIGAVSKLENPAAFGRRRVVAVERAAQGGGGRLFFRAGWLGGKRFLGPRRDPPFPKMGRTTLARPPFGETAVGGPRGKGLFLPPARQAPGQPGRGRKSPEAGPGARAGGARSRPGWLPPRPAAGAGTCRKRREIRGGGSSGADGAFSRTPTNSWLGRPRSSTRPRKGPSLRAKRRAGVGRETGGPDCTRARGWTASLRGRAQRFPGFHLRNSNRGDPTARDGQQAPPGGRFFTPWGPTRHKKGHPPPVRRPHSPENHGHGLHC